MLSRRPRHLTQVKGQAWEFLPAVLEIEETPPSPVGRMVTWTIIAVFAAAFLWAAFGTIDIVAIAQGKIIPSGHSKVIQSLESGVIRAIHVQNGQEVQEGKVLIELDTTANSADHDRLVNELQAARLDVARLRAVLAGKDAMPAPPGTDPTQLTVQSQLLRDQLDEHQTRLEMAKLVIEQRQQGLAATNANISRLKALIPMFEERATSYYQLWQKTYVAKLQYLDVEKDRIERVQELAVQEHKRVQDTAALAEAQKQLQTIRAEFKRVRLAELVGAETKVASLVQEVAKAHNRKQLQHLTAPIDGVVQQLAVHTLGGVVTPAQQLLVIVPKVGPLEVEAWVENKDIGFVHIGQQAEIKVAAFPFTRYGTIPAQVRTLSHDAVSPEKDGTVPAQVRTLSPDVVQPENSGLVYAARMSLERTAIQVEGTPVALSPGMAVTVEIKTGKRRLLEYFLSPVLQAGQESIRER
jgi:hemolysin D